MPEPDHSSPFDGPDVLVDPGPPPAPADAVDPPTEHDAAPAAPGREPKPPTLGELRRERKRLWDEREETVYHVGGLAVDLRRRGIEDVELINRRADHVLSIDTRLNEVDATLEQIDTRRRGTRPVPAAGYCMSCGAPFQIEAAFCFRCGARVALPDEEPEPSAPAETPTAVIDAGGYPPR